MQVALLGHGVAADIGDAARLECAGGFEELGGGAGARRVDGKDIDPLVVVGGVQDVIGGVVGHKPSAAGEAVELGIATCVGNARRVALHAEQHNADTSVLGILRGAQTDGAATAVSVHKNVTLLQVHAVNRELIEQLGLLRIGLVERGGGDIELAAEQLVAHAFGAIDDTSLLTQDGIAGATVDVLSDGDDMRIKRRDGFKELLRMRQVALSGHEGDHNLVGAPAAANDGIAKQPQMLVFVKGRNMQTFGLASDAVENLTSARRLDRAFRNSNDPVRPTFKKAAADSALFAGSKRSGSLMTKTTRRRILARVAQGNTHTANGINGNTLALTELSKQLLHSSLLGRQLLLIRTIERRAPTASFHDRTGRLGVHNLTRRRNRIFMRALGASLRCLILAPTRTGALGLSLALGRLTLRILRRLGFRRRFFLLRPLSRLDQSTTSLTLRTRFCHQ